VRVVFLTTEFPWPATSGGPVRTLSQLRVLGSLASVERITLVSVTERIVTDTECDALAAAVPKLAVVRPVFHPIHLWHHASYVPRVLRLRLGGVPYLAAKWDSPALRRTLRRALRASAADVVYVDHLGMARYLPDIRAERPGSRIVLDQHNVESELFKQFAESRTGPSKLVATAEWRAAAHFERGVLGAVDAVVAISRADARHFQGIARVPAHVVPVVMEFERRVRAHPGRPHFCYVGSLGWHPNVAGLNWFCQKVWPKIRMRVPDATLDIAGVGLHRHAGGRLRVPGAWRMAGIEAVGFLEDLEPLYARSVAMIAPVRGGTGVRIKVLEALGAGLPVVTTGDGVSGLPLTDDREVLIANEPDAFTERVERVARDETLRTRLRDAGYAYLEASHSRAAAQRPLRAALGLG
jgi:polysaccharide biosynthesis protein PslH